MFYSDDPILDAERHAAEQDRELDALPKCDYCEEPIQDDFFYYINGECYCSTCLDNHFRKATDNYIA